MAVKLVDPFVRKEGWTHGEFLDYLRNDHAELVEQLPNLRKYAVSVPADLHEYDVPFPNGPDDADYDAIVELYFEDIDDLFASLESEVGEELHEDAETFLNPGEGPTYIVDEEVRPADAEA